MEDWNACEKETNGIELRMKLKTPDSSFRDIVNLYDKDRKKLQNRFMFNEVKRQKSRKQDVFNIKQEKPVSTSFGRTSMTHPKPSMPRINKSINFYNKTNAFDHFIKKNGNFTFIDNIMDNVDKKKNTSMEADAHLSKNCEQIIDNLDRHIKYHSKQAIIQKGNYKRIKFERSNSNINFLSLYQDSIAKDDALDKDISKAIEVRLSSKQHSKNKIRFSKSQSSFCKIQKKEISENFYNKVINPEEVNQTFITNKPETEIPQKRMLGTALQARTVRSSANFSYTKGFLQRIREPETTKKIEKRKEMNTFIRQQLENEIDPKTKKLDTSLRTHNNAMSYIIKDNDITMRSKTYKIDYKIKNRNMQIKLNHLELDKCFLKHWKNTQENKRSLNNIFSQNQAKRLFQQFLDKLKDGNKIYTISIPENVRIDNKDSCDFYKEEPRDRTNTNYLKTLSTILNTLVTEFIEDNIVRPDPFDDIARDFFEAFSQLDVDEIKNLTAIYIHPHNPHHRVKTPPRPLTPEPPKPVKKVEIRSFVKDGDEFSLRPSTITMKYYNTGDYKERYKSYWLQCIDKLVKAEDLNEHPEEVGYNKLFSWYTKKKEIMKGVFTETVQNSQRKINNDFSGNISRAISPLLSISPEDQSKNVSKRNLDVKKAKSRKIDTNNYLTGGSKRIIKTKVDFRELQKDFADAILYKPETYEMVPDERKNIIFDSMLDLFYNVAQDTTSDMEPKTRHNEVLEELKQNEYAFGQKQEENFDEETHEEIINNIENFLAKEKIEFSNLDVSLNLRSYSEQPEIVEEMYEYFNEYVEDKQKRLQDGENTSEIDTETNFVGDKSPRLTELSKFDNPLIISELDKESCENKISSFENRFTDNFEKVNLNDQEIKNIEIVYPGNSNFE